MKLTTIRATAGWVLPKLRLSGLTVEVADIIAQGWRVSIRGSRIFFHAPPDEKGRSLVYDQPDTNFSLGWEFEKDDQLEATRKYSTPAAGDGKK